MTHLQRTLIRTTLFGLFLFAFSFDLSAQVTTLWQRSQATGNIPTYIGTTSAERGIAYGVFQGQPRLFLASSNGNKILMLDPATGDSVGALNTSTVTGGTLTLSDIEVSEDGYVFATNVVATSAATTPLKVYRWANATDTPTVVATYQLGGYRLGDRIAIGGSQTANTLNLFVPRASGANVVYFSTTDGGTTFTAVDYPFTGQTVSTMAAVAPIGNGANGFYHKSNSYNVRKFKSLSGPMNGFIDPNMIKTTSNAMKYFEAGGRKFLVAFCYGYSTSITTENSFMERGLIYEISGTDTTGGVVGVTPSLGITANSNYAGDVAVVANGDGTFTIFVLSTNNGLGAYKFTPAGASFVMTPPYMQDFSSFYTPANWTRLAGWLKQNSVTTVYSGIWLPDDYLNITSPVNRATKVNIYGTGRYHWLVSPSVNLTSGHQYQCEFDLGLTKWNYSTPDTLGPDDSVAVVLSTDNGVTWSSDNILKLWTAASPWISNLGQHEVLTIPATVSGPIKIGIYAASSVSNKDNDIFIDNFMIRETPSTPQFAVSPELKDFGRIQTGLSSPPQEFTVSNIGVGTLMIQSVALAGPNVSSFVVTDTNTYPKPLGLNQSLKFSVKFAPADTGVKNAVINITDNLTKTVHPVPITGRGMDFTIATFPYNEGFEAGVVPPEGWTNPGGYWNRGTESHSGTYCARIAYNFSTTTQAYLISPPINLPPNAQISFWWKDDDITAGKVANHDTTWFEISTDAGTTWTTLEFLSAPSAMTAYVQVTKNLAAYAGNARLIRWRDKTDGVTAAYGTGLDDIQIIVLEPPPITVTSPNGGENWQTGSQQNITWSMYGTTVTAVNIKFSKDNGATWNTVATNVPATPSTYAWNVPYTPTTQGKIRISNAAQDTTFDVSDNPFTITGLAITWAAPLVVKDNANVNGTITFGAAPSATNGIDAGLGEVALGNIPPAGTFDARFELPITPVTTTLIDYRADTVLSIVWKIKFQPGAGGYPMTFTWNVADLPPGNFFLTDAPGTTVNVNMKTVNTYTLTNPAITTLKIEYTKQLSVPIALAAGWNMVSVPVVATDMSATALYAGANSSVFWYNNTYLIQTTLDNGRGYWVRYPSAANVTFNGFPVAVNTVPLNAGWNMIGPFHYNVATSAITTTPTGIINSEFFGFNNGYVGSTTLEKGKGYWVRTSAAGVMNLPAGLAKDVITQSVTDNFVGKILVSDAAGNSSALSFTSDAQSLRYDLPPLPPNGVFDVRFASQRSAENLSSAQQINISGASYPVSIMAEGCEIRIRDKATNGKIVDQILRNGQSVQIGNAGVNTIEVSLLEKPVSYELYQNYPNPFNPSTSIRFGLPEKANVTLTVFNQLGERVATLLSGEKEAGYYTFDWNAGNLTSGVYFYELRTDKFSSIKKLILMK